MLGGVISLFRVFVQRLGYFFNFLRDWREMWDVKEDILYRESKVSRDIKVYLENGVQEIRMWVG